MKKSILMPALFLGAGANAACPASKAADILNCAITCAPNVVRANSTIPIAKINAELSGRRLNPELEAGIGYNGEESDYRGIQADVAIMQTIETRARRNARKGKALAEYAAAGLSAEEQKEAAAAQAMAAMNRLRQIDKELAALAETIESFGKIVKKYKKRPVLSPEDRVSLDLFEIALNNYKIENDKILAEQRELQAALAAILGERLPQDFQPFLYAPKKWPVPGAAEPAEDNTELAKEGVNLALARANYLEAKSAAFPGVRAGPYMQTRPGNMGRIDTFGVKLSLPLPLFSGGKSSEMGAMAVAAAEQSLDFKKNALTNDFAVLKEKYRLGVKSLAGFDISAMEQSHHRTEKLFAGSRVSSSLFIEAHRQMLDGIKTYHNYEIETLYALWKIYSMQRKLLTNIEELYHE